MPTKTTKKSAATSSRKAGSSTTLKRATLKTTSAKKAGKSPAGDVMGLPVTTWVQTARLGKGNELRSGKRGFVFAFANGSGSAKLLKAELKEHLNKWQMDQLLASEAEQSFFQGALGPVWVLRLIESKLQAAQTGTQNGQPFSSPLAVAMPKSTYARMRDMAGTVVPQLAQYSLEKLILSLHGLQLDEEKAVLIGLEMATYSFGENRRQNPKPRKNLPTLLLRNASAQLDQVAITAASQLAMAVNIARHFINLPGADLNPRTYAECVENMFDESDSVQVDVWAGERLKKERMNLLLAVGGAASEGPRMIHLRYRPKSASKSLRPLAIVGKGITFDSGGLDIKSSSGMRLMKKDMGGSAAAVGIAKWADMVQLAYPLDIYLSVAENAVSGLAFRPGDIIQARNGLAIEINNTDAEGRLVLADALDVAVNQTGVDEPIAVIDLATLTGAIKTALGAEVAGLFSNHDELAQMIFSAGESRGDLSWRMPLYQPYKSMLRSTFADHGNSAEGYAGAVTAALFLELFVKGKPWAHLDIYSWKESAGGALAESGGTGQSVQAICEMLVRLAQTVEKVDE